MIAGGIAFYLIPASDRAVGVRWWQWALLAGMFFAAVGIHTWRRRHRSLSALHQTLRDEKRRGG